MYGVCRICTEVAAVSCGTSHVTAKWCCKYTTVVGVKKHTHAHAVKGYSHPFSYMVTCNQIALPLNLLKGRE